MVVLDQPVIESSCRGQPTQAVLQPRHSRLHGYATRLRKTISSWLLQVIEAPYRGSEHDTILPLIEDYPTGYPRLTALIGSHRTFHIFRRFVNLRTRLLLLKQDRLTVLEEQLAKVDTEETNLLSLGSVRADSNDTRKNLIVDIDAALVEYDELLERNQRVLNLEPASPRNVSNIQNWINGTGSIARRESAYLAQSGELVSVAGTDDRVIPWLESSVEDGMAYLRSQFSNSHQVGASRDRNIHIPTGSLMVRLARIVMTVFIIFLLLVPVVVCNFLGSLTARLFSVIISTTIFVAVLSGSTKAKTIELIIGGATYTTVMIVFVSTTGQGAQ
ncbi:hypothetical protein KJ359_005930 [Pestalotiopsis sp. 9143b]|nr:hypothetical protein KJ359_005930 [Pestalotiopsis sp. 9143b]